MSGAGCPGRGSEEGRRNSAGHQRLLSYNKESGLHSEDEVSWTEVSKSDLHCRSLTLAAI